MHQSISDTQYVIKQGFSQDFRTACPIPFHPIALHTQNMEIRVSKIINRGSCYLCVAPSLWNKLPDHVRNMYCLKTFQGHVKAHLFTQSLLHSLS